MVTVYNDEQYEFFPDAGKSYSVGWKILMASFVELLVISIVYMILSGPVGVIQVKISGGRM